MRMRVGILLSVLCLWPLRQASAAVTRDTFLIRSTADIVALCDASETDPMRDEAVSFCHGYLVGAWHYHQAEQAGPDARPIVCFPDPPPTREQAINGFIAWAKEHPEYGNDRAVDTLFRYLTGKWPCPERHAEQSHDHAGHAKGKQVGAHP